jgi:hypothetical protein
MTTAPAIGLTFVIGYLMICGLWIALLASKAQLDAQREETEKLTKRSNDLRHDVEYLSVQLDQSIDHLFDPKALIPSASYPSTNGYVSIDQSA